MKINPMNWMHMRHSEVAEARGKINDISGQPTSHSGFCRNHRNL